MGNMVLLCFVCSDHKPVLLSLFMTYPRTFQMNNTTGAFNETGTSCPSGALYFTPDQCSSIFSFQQCFMDNCLFCYHFVMSIASFMLRLQLLITSLLSSDFFLPTIRKLKLIMTMSYTLIEIDIDICSSYYFYICRVCTCVFLFKCDT